ncbi:MAG: TonB-dependent receptor [Candidatus Solibacter usitatus]|nr:TonB-dependent receptor [Candidatus Solibacter usitatus]
MLSQLKQIAVLMLLAAVTVSGQSFTASVVGNVTDSSGAAIPNVRIVAINTATNAKAEGRSDGTGRYVVAQVQPGVYTLEAAAAGFKKFVQSRVELAVGQQAKIDIGMAVGEITENVTVEATVSTIETTTSTIGKVVSNKAILNLPLNSRNIYSLIYLTPGVAGSIGNNYNSMSYSINGARASMMDTLIDGATASHPTVQGYSGISAFPSVDAIGEFKVLGANFQAEYGRTAGSVLNVVYKSGTNDFHGTAYEFLRNSKLDANTFYNNVRGLPLSSFKRSQYGGTFGGPVKRDRTFFMSSYEGLRQRNFSSRTSTVPTALERAGNFTQTFAGANNPVVIYDPWTTRASGSAFVRDAFPGNVVPAGRQDKVGQNYTKYYPQPNTQGAAYTNANNYYNQGSSTLDIDQIDGRFDHSFTSNQRLFVRYSYRNQDSLPAVLWPAELKAAETTNNERNRMHNGVIDYTATPNATTVLSVRGGLARSLYFYENLGLGFLASSLGLPAALDTAGGLSMFPQLSASGYTTLGNQDNRYNAFMTYTLAGSMTKLKGAHTLKAGYDGRLIRVNNRESRATSGTFAFTAGFTQGPNPNTAASNRGNSIASLLLGTGSSGSLIQSFKDAAAQSVYTALYFQDDWRITKKLTLNLGLRYDLDTPRTERYNRMNYFDPAARSPLADKAPGYSNLRGGLVFVGVNGQPRTQYIMDTNNLAPRIGFAYQVAPKTTIRGGFGNIYAISLQQAHGTVGPFGFRTQTPWVSTIDGITPNYLVSNPYPAGFQATPGSSQGLLTQAGANIQAPVQETLTPYSMQWNFNVQRSLPGDILLEAAYVGTRGLQLSRNDEGGLSLNQLDPKYMALGSQLNQTVDNPFYGIVNSGVLAAARISRAQLLRPYPQFTDVIPLYSTGASANYHSLQVSFSKRFSRGFQFEGSYTWAKAIQEALSHADSYNMRASRSLADYDVAHRFVVSYIYELPFGKGRRFGADWKGLTNAVLGGWQFNGFTSVQTGTPLSISANNVAGLFNSRGLANNNGTSAKRTGDIHDRLLKYFDTSVFSQPAAFTFGNTQPSSPDLRSPGVRNWDLSLFKDFRITEKLQLQFRTEAFNALNTVRFGSPNTSVTSNQFGQISTQANSPRQVQFGLKLLF